MTNRSFRDEHILFERQTWKRSLDFISAECIHCKNHLAILVNNCAEHDIIELSEKYLNQLLQIEGFVKILRREIAYFDRAFIENSFVNAELTRNRTGITAQLLRVQNDFCTVRSELLTRFSQRE